MIFFSLSHNLVIECYATFRLSVSYYLDFLWQILSKFLVLFTQGNLFVLCKFVSAVQNLPGTFKYLADILRHAREGAMFLFIDNAHLQTKSFIEELVFPGGAYKQLKDCRESDTFKLYTTYAELKSVNDANLNSSLMCEWLGMINFWLDRYPMLDLRVNVMLAIKKSVPSSSKKCRSARWHQATIY